MRVSVRVNFPILLTLLFSSPVWGEGVQERIDALIARDRPLSGILSVKIVDLADGTPLYQRNAERALNPASTAKLVTIGAALKYLGPEFSWRLEFSSPDRLSNGRIGDLWVRGTGDPFFVTESMEQVVRALKDAGLTAIDGSIVVDESYFSPERQTTYVSFDNGLTHEVATGALSFNFNTVEIVARPGAAIGDRPILDLKPSTPYAAVVNQARTSGRTRRTLMTRLTEVDGKRTILLKGNLPKRLPLVSVRQAVPDPALFLGMALQARLEREGIHVGGGIRTEKVPPGIRSVYTYRSPPLRELLGGLGKHSNNFMAEQILTTIGAVRYGAPGSLSKGLKAVSEYLSDLQVPEGEYYLENGSGLSRISRLSADHLIRVLQDLYRSRWRDDLLQSLSVYGIDGTLSTRPGVSLRGRVFAKTGSLNGVSALAGYLESVKGPVAFALLLNGPSAHGPRAMKLRREILEAVMEGREVAL